MSVFGSKMNLNQAQESKGGGVFFSPKRVTAADAAKNTPAVYATGEYLAEVETTKMQETRGGLCFVLETIIRRSNSDDRSPGSRCTWMVNVDKVEAAPGNIKSLMIALAGSAVGRPLSAQEIADEDWNAIAEDAVTNNRFKGDKVEINAFLRLKKKQSPTPGVLDAMFDKSFFTMCNFNAVSEKVEAA